MNPTKEGKKRYPPDGFYVDDEFDFKEPCVCMKSCPLPCNGMQGCYCEACKKVYLDMMADQEYL